jgi:hypothetical protein
MSRYLYIILILFLILFANSCGTQDSEETLSKTNTFKVQRGVIDPSVPVSIRQSISLIFSSALDSNSIDGNVFLELIYMVGSGYDEDDIMIVKVPTKVEIGSKATDIKISPLEYLKPTSNYRIVVKTGLRDTQGRSLSRDYIYTFTTDDESVDTSPLIIRSSKPSDGDTQVYTKSDIVIDFSKNIADLPTDYNLSQYMKFKVNNVDVNISGRLEVFNSLLKFIPDQPWPYASNISFSLDHNISDLYGTIYDDGYGAEFSTITEGDYTDQTKGYASIVSIDTNKKSYMVRNLQDTNASYSLIAVARDSGIDVYAINYEEILTKPTLSLKSSISISSKVTDMKTYYDMQTYDSMLFVSTVSDGVFFYKITKEGIITQNAHLNEGESIYGVDIYENEDGYIERMYSVGPHFGLQLYDVDSAMNVTLATKVSTDETVVAIDVLHALDNGVNKIYVADYKGRMVVFNSDATNIESISSIDMSVKRLDYQQDYNGVMGVYAVGTSGKVQGIGFDGGILQNVKSNLPTSSNDIVSYVDSDSFFSKVYYANGHSGVVIADGDYISGNIDTAGDTVSVDIARLDLTRLVDGYEEKVAIYFLITLNEYGKLQLFNAVKSLSTPSFEGYFPTTEDISLGINSSYLDEATISEDSFALYDKNTSSAVPFTYNRTYFGEYQVVPDTELTDGDEYILTIKGTISDMLGYKFNDAQDMNISFIAGDNS